MRDKHQRGTSLLRTFEQNIDDFFASGTVKISGWLIGHIMGKESKTTQFYGSVHSLRYTNHNWH